jgi:AraC family transcriptional regulator
MNYCENIQKSIDYIENNIKEDIDINMVVQQSGYSTTHFYRIFQAFMGEAIKEYIIKRKLSNAAIELAVTNKRLIEVAIDYGFNSQEVFTRAFTKLFHITPGRYRKSKSSIVLYEKINAYQKLMDHIGDVLIPKIVLEKEFKIVGLKKTVKPGSALIRTLWDEFTSRKCEVANAVTKEDILGICEYLPSITDESEFEYLAGVEVKDYDYIPDGMITKTIPLSKYAVFTHKGSVSDLKATYDNIYGKWLPLSGIELAEADTIEIYSLKDNQESTLDIYIPLQIE